MFTTQVAVLATSDTEWARACSGFDHSGDVSGVGVYLLSVIMVGESPLAPKLVIFHTLTSRFHSIPSPDGLALWRYVAPFMSLSLVISLLSILF